MSKPIRRRPKNSRSRSEQLDRTTKDPETSPEGAPEAARGDGDDSRGRAPDRARRRAGAARAARPVVRDASGAIVGVRRRAGPRIVGFKPLPSSPRKREVIITVAQKPRPPGRASRHKLRQQALHGGRRRPPRRTRRSAGRGGAGPSGTKTMRAEKRVVRVDGEITTRGLAQQLGRKAGDVLRVLWRAGMRGLTVNSSLELEVAALVAETFGYTARDVAVHERDIVGAQDDAATGELRARAPVVCVLGHVDHGKTTLLDRVRASSVAAREAGGITQGVAAYRVEAGARGVVFLDTPGHAAFAAMRARGVDVTDIVALVVAADDGVMPTTVEVIERARAAGVPIVVAINKIDLPDANPGRVKQELMTHGLVGEEFGGDVLMVELSAKTGVGLAALLEALALQAELMELRARVDAPAAGVVLEAQLDRGLGPVASVIVRSGTLRVGQVVVVGERSGKVRALHDERGAPLDEAGPSTPVRLSGLDGPPPVGARIEVVPDERAARQLIELRAARRRRGDLASRRAPRSLADTLRRGRTKLVSVVLRARTAGAAEALAGALRGLSCAEVELEVIAAGAGAITPGDVALAAVSDARVLGFGARPVGSARRDAAREGVVIQCVDVIHDALDWARVQLAAQLEPERRERVVGEAEVRALFPTSEGVVAGCRVLSGALTRRARIRVRRRGESVHEGPIESLRVHKDDVPRVRVGLECGVLIGGARELELGDILEAFELELIARAYPPTP